MRRIAITPADRFRRFVVVPDIPADFASEVGDGGEDAAREQVALDLGKPEFDLIQPRRIRRREMQVHARMSVEEGLHAPGLVRREVVDNHVDLASTRLRRNHIAQELDEGSLVWRGTVWPMISPVRVLSAAYRESVPCR